jgi:hypothetical protein
MAEQGYVLDIDAKFIERLGKADEALDKFVKSTDKLSQQFDKLASGGLSRFANAIDSIVQSISQVSRVDIGDMGISNASNSAAAAVDNINDISSAIQNVQEVSKRTTLSFDISDYVKPSEVNAEIAKTEKAIKNATDKLEYWQNKLSTYQEFDPTMQKADTKKAVRKIAEWETQIKSLNETYKRLNDDLEVARARAQELANAANSTEFKDIATWKAIKEAQQELIDTGGFASRAEQQPIVDKFAQAQEQIKDQMVSTKEFAEMNDDERYQMELRQLARRQKSQDDAAKAEQERLKENERVQNDIEKSRLQQSLKHLDDESKAIAEGQKAKEEARRKIAKADTENIIKSRKERQEALEAETKAQQEAIKKAQEAYTKIVNEIQAEYKQVLAELNQVADQKYKLDLFKAKHGETDETKKADEEILRRQTELNAKRENLETNYQKHLTSVVEDNEKNRAKVIVDNIERQHRIAMENQKRLDNEKEKNAKADAQRTHEERTTFSGAMGYSKTTKSINDQIQAIKYLEEARNKLDKTTLGAKEYKRQVKEINNEITRQKKEVDELTNKQRQLNDVAGKLRGMLGSMFSISAIRGYVNQIIQVRGEFELQQRALQALLQNKAEANKLWEQTVQLAVRSPFQVKELVTYTKQLAAYRVETEKLHDTTKMLADISAGLGVDMGRLILAFGQVKAANYLRGTELRQFSEAGINILDELARYYSALEGKMVTVGEVFERVSKRMVSFTDVERVLQNVTSAGGMFYKMQEIQAETLKGSISNLKDQLDLMLNDIGKSNEGILKGGVQVASWLIKNYTKVIPVLTTVGLAFAGMYLNTQRVTSGLKAIGRGGANLIKGLLNPWTLALAAVSEVISAIIRYEQEVAQITKEHNRLRDSLHEIEIAFRDAMNKDAVDGMRNSMSQLVEFAKNEFQIDLKLNDEELKSMDFSVLEAKFVELRDILFDSNAVAENIKKGLAAARNWDTTFMRILNPFDDTKSIFDESMFADIRQFEKSAQDVLVGIQAESKRIANELQLDTAHMLRLPQAPLETNLQYVNRLAKAYEGLRDEMEMKGIDTSEIDGYIKKLRKDTDEASRELGIFFTKYEDQIVHLSEEQKKAFINNIVNSEGWSEYTKELIYNLYNLDLERVIPKALAQFDIDKLDESGKTTTQKDTSWENLLRTIKEANSAYKELTNTFDGATAKEGMLIKYSDALNDVLSKIVINGQKLNASQFLEMFNITTEEGMLKALDMIAEKAPEAADKLKAKLEKGKIEWEANIETKEGTDKKLTDFVQNLFSGYELSMELDKLNVPADLAKDLFNLDATSLDEVRRVLESRRGEFVGEEMEKEYEKAIKRIDELEDKAQKERLTKYVQYLVKGQGERVKIKLDEMRQIAEIESLPFDESQKELALEAARAEANKRLKKLEWEEFKDSGMYVRLFEDLEFASSRTLNLMRDKMIDLKAQLGDLDADDLKHLYDQLEKLDNELVERNPYKALAESANDYFKSLKRLKDAEAELVVSQDKQSSLETQFSDTSALLSAEKSRYEQMSRSSKASAEDLEKQRAKVEALNAQLLLIKAQLLAQGKLTKALEDEIDALTKARKMFTGSVEEIGRDISDVANALPQVAGHLENVFGTMSDGTRDTLDSIATIGGGIGDAIQGFASGNYVQAIMGIAQAIGGIFAIGDKAKERKIQRELKHVEELDKRYQQIEEALDDMYSTQQMSAYTKELSSNIDEQIESYERLIQLEQDKKKTDTDKIDDYYDKIEELTKQREEMYKEMSSQATAGILDNALSAAEGFVDAWLDAFKETGDGLSGLEEEFTEMLTNLVKRQAAMQIVGLYIEKYSNWLKDYINPEKGDMTLTAEEAKEWAERIRETLPEMSETLEGFFSGMQGLLGGDDGLSDLSKGIQGITETTAQALEALLNSMRFYVADSNIRLKNIEAAFANSDISKNPLLNELRQQTAIIKSIEEMFGSVIGRGSGSHSGAYLKVLV